MSQQADKQKSLGNQEKKKTRRTRKDEQGRNFTCACGKSYLSYPALYTHIKTKHQGKVPKQDGSYIAVQTSQLQQQVQNKDPIAMTKQLLDKYFQQNQPVSALSYPTCLSQAAQLYISKILNSWELVKDQKMDDPSNNLSQNINYIFGRFLYQIKSKHINGLSFIYICQLIWSLYNGIGVEIMQGNIKQRDKNLSNLNGKDRDFGNYINGTQLVHYFNIFMLKNNQNMSISHLNKENHRKNIQEYERFQQVKKGSPVNNSFLTAKIIQNLGTWLFEIRYTNFISKLNQNQNI